jgi:hypothetical protein
MLSINYASEGCLLVYFMNGVGTQTIAWADDRLCIDVWFCIFFCVCYCLLVVAVVLVFGCRGFLALFFSFLSLLLCNAFESLYDI